MERLIELHNQARERGGWLGKRKPLSPDDKLMAYAQTHANWMAEQNKLRHSSMENVMKLGLSRAAENIAWGQKTPETVMASWLWSPGHRSNLLSYAYDRIGCGARKDAGGRLYWCVCFGRA
jgi:uncharacterized protein YkwD